MLSGQGLADYALSKLGTPYFYGAKMQVLTESYMASMRKSYPGTVTASYVAKARKKGMVGKVCVDCSGLIGAYRGKQIGSSQLYSSAKKRLPISNIKDFAIGTVLYKKGHVGVYIGMDKSGEPMCVEAKGIDYGVVKTKVSSTKWTYGLTFDDMSYSYAVTVPGTAKPKNPYPVPTRNIKKGCKGDDVKWVQFELVEAGHKIEIDGDAGSATHKAIVSFQKSAKLTADGICGKDTRKALLLN